jgi:hypothetical protein
MKTLRHIPLAVAALALVACSDLTHPDGRATAPRAPQTDLSVGSVVCSGTLSNTYTPGILVTPRTVSLQRNLILAPCVSLSDTTLTSGISSGTSNTSVSCLTVAVPQSGVNTITWNNGQTSVFTFNQIVNNIGGQATLTATGTITAGQFAGHTAVRQATGPSINVLDCLQEPGITSRFYLVQFTIL